MVYYFAYGMNMDTKEMKCRCPSARDPVPGKIKDFELVFNKKDATNSRLGFANIVEKIGSIVEGILYTIEEKDFDKLDSFEGGSKNYERKERNILTDNGTFLAHIYIANPDMVVTGLIPSRDYIENLLKAKDFLSEGYLNKIKDILSFTEWFDRSSYSNDPFYKFEDLWKSFNKYLTLRYKEKIYQRDRIQVSENHLVDEFKTDEYNFSVYNDLIKKKEFIEKLKKFRESFKKPNGEYYIIRMDSPKEKVYFRDINKFIEFVSVLYQIRCNSVHGEKPPYGPNDPKIMINAYEVLRVFLKELYAPWLKKA